MSIFDTRRKIASYPTAIDLNVTEQFPVRHNTTFERLRTTYQTINALLCSRFHNGDAAWDCAAAERRTIQKRHSQGLRFAGIRWLWDGIEFMWWCRLLCGRIVLCFISLCGFARSGFAAKSRFVRCRWPVIAAVCSQVRSDSSILLSGPSVFVGRRWEAHRSNPIPCKIESSANVTPLPVGVGCHNIVTRGVPTLEATRSNNHDSYGEILHTVCNPIETECTCPQ
jgi:hypothetical protein